jgi:catechol 2,3-dioxygenase-like lactoylglutathione lyase family enzyme
MAVPMITRFSHWSIAVANLDRSSAFYESVLGCERVGDSCAGTDTHEIPAARAAQLECDGQRFDLLQFDTP